MRRNLLLAAGIASSVLYVCIDWVAAFAFPRYHSFTALAVSELMAAGAPTERLVDPLFLLYDVLVMAFAVGVWRASTRRRLRIAAALLFAYGAFGLLGPTVFEMNVRGAEMTPADKLHAAATAVLVLFIFATVAVAAPLWGRRFRNYSWASIALMLVFGVLTAVGMSASGLNPLSGLYGLTERINIGAFLLWVVLFARRVWLESSAGEFGGARVAAN